MTVLLAALALLQSNDETYSVVLSVRSMHCEECRATLESRLGAVSAIKKVEIDPEKKTVTLTVLEKHPIHLRSLQAFVPGDMKLERAVLTMRGTASAFGMMLRFKAKGSGADYELGDKDPKKNDRQAALREAMKDGKRKFRLTGELLVRDKREVLAIDSFEPVEWKD